MPNYNDLIAEIKQQTASLADAMVSKYAAKAKQEVNDFLESTKGLVKTWADQLAEGKMTVAEFEDLVAGLGDIAKLKVLKNAALAQQRVNQFIGAVLNIIIDIVLRKVLI